MTRDDAGDAAGPDPATGAPRDGGVDDPGGFATLTYEEFSCEHHAIVAIRDRAAEDRWIQSTLAVPVRR